jgi:hypothetical protein
MSTLAELEELQAKRREERAKLEDAQRAVDLQARFDLEDEHVEGGIAAVSVSRFVPGQPTQAYVRTPTPVEYKRYLDQVHRGVDKKSLRAQRDAQELLAQSCWVYPRKPEDRQAMLAIFPGILTPISVAAAALAEGRSEEEGKG